MAEYKILIVEDDLTIAGVIARHFEKWNYQVECIEDFKNVTQKVAEYEPHLILLDISLPFYNGFYWCGEIRKISSVPIVFLSSSDDNMNIIMAMDMGADDFISKPFELSVLTAKVGALMRRTYSFKTNTNLMEHKGVILNVSEGKIFCGEKTETLTKNEFFIMQLLMENAGKVVSRDSIMLRLWEGDDFVDDNTLTVNMTRIRKKLAEIGAENYIVTKKGIGYMV